MELRQSVSRALTFLSNIGNVARQHTVYTIISGVCILALIIWGVIALIAIPDTGPEVGKRAPDFTLQTIDGQSITLSSFRGKMVMLSFGCPVGSCPDEKLSREAYAIQAVHDKWSSEELMILRINVRSDRGEVQDFITKYGLTFPFLLDSEQVRTDYDVIHGGKDFFIDTKGIIRAISNGHLHSQNEIERILTSIKNNKEIKSITPAITNVSVSAITDTSAIITWMTDKPATSDAIVYDEQIGICIGIWPDETLVTDHRITVEGLSPGATYQFQVLSGYNLENQGISEKHSFTTLTTTDISPPTVIDVNVSNITESNATVEWNTDEPAISELEYWSTDPSDSISLLDVELTTSHNFKLTELEPDTTYHFRIKAKYASQSQAISEMVGTFTTLSTTSIGLNIGRHAPDFTLRNIDGESVMLSEFQGKLVVLNFWLTSCGACRSEIPHIQAVFNKWSSDELVILTVNVRGSVSLIQRYIKIQGLTFPVLVDSQGDVCEKYGVSRFPTTFFIDTEGNIGAIKEGTFESPDEIDSIINSVRVKSELQNTDK